jgi:hypothetical protein
VLRTADGTWFALTGRRRGGRLTDLVFSFTRKDRPRWQDFEHVTLTGRCADAVFDHEDRTLTGGLLLEGGGRVCVVFGWNVGVFFVRLDVTRPGWARWVRDPTAWLDLADNLNLRPTSVASTYREGTVLHDAYLPGNGWPAVLCSDLKLAPGAGFEVVEGEEAILHIHRRPGAAESTREYPFPSFRATRCLQTPDGKVLYAAQKTAGGPLQLGTFDPPAGIQTRRGVDYFLLPAAAASPFAVARPAAPGDSLWLRVHWDADKGETLTPLTSPPALAQAVPLPWSDTKRDGVCWVAVETDPVAGPAFAYQAKPSVGANELGLLVDRKGLISFSLRPLTP